MNTRRRAGASSAEETRRERSPSPTSDSRRSSFVEPESSFGSPRSLTSPGSVTDSNSSLRRVVGEVRDASGKAPGSVAALKSLEKWITAALKQHGKTWNDLLIDQVDCEPNDELCSQVNSQIGGWFVSRTTAKDAGVVCGAKLLVRPPPKCCTVLTVNRLKDYINEVRTQLGKRSLPKDWGTSLPNRAADSKAVNQAARKRTAEEGTLYHHKHDVAPSPKQLTTMCTVGFTGDQRVHAEILDALEAGMSLALYLPTGARGSELKQMLLQSLGYETKYNEDAGLSFECLKLTAFDTKTKDQHLNQVLPHSNPWRCGVGSLGLSLLLRVKLHGPPPFSMAKTDASWMIFGSSSNTLDKRIKAVFDVAGLRTQTGDPITYMGRHYGTRYLQDQGGTAEGGAARGGWSNGTARHHYTEVPLPDLLKQAGNPGDKPFPPAHHGGSGGRDQLNVLADEVLACMFPALAEHDKKLAHRNEEVDLMGGKARKVRKVEQLCDQEKLTRALRLCCRTGLCCLVARPRLGRSIIEDETSMWQRRTDEDQRVIKELFDDDDDAIEKMEALAKHVHRLEDAEIHARSIAPDQAVVSHIGGGLEKLLARQEAQMARQEAHMERMEEIHRKPANDSAPSVSDGATSRANIEPTVEMVIDQLIKDPSMTPEKKASLQAAYYQYRMDSDSNSFCTRVRELVDQPTLDSALTEVKNCPTPGTTAKRRLVMQKLADCDHAPRKTSTLSEPLASAKNKRPRLSQEDVKHFSECFSPPSTRTDLEMAMDYWIKVLVPRDDKDGCSWRIVKGVDGVENRSRHDMWLKYHNMAFAVGWRMEDEADGGRGMSYEEAMVNLKELFDSRSDTAFHKCLKDEKKKQNRGMVEYCVQKVKKYRRRVP